MNYGGQSKMRVGICPVCQQIGVPIEIQRLCTEKEIGVIKPHPCLGQHICFGTGRVASCILEGNQLVTELKR